MILSDDLFFTWCDSTIEFVTGFNVEFVAADAADADADADVADNADADDTDADDTDADDTDADDIEFFFLCLQAWECMDETYN